MEIEVEDVAEALAVESRELVKLCLVVLPAHLLLAELHQTPKSLLVAIAQHLVVEHRDERRREVHGHPKVDAVANERLETHQQRQIGPGQSLIEPVLLEESLVIGLAHERQVRMEHHREVAQGVAVHMASGSYPALSLRVIAYRPLFTNDVIRHSVPRHYLLATGRNV